MVALNLYPVDIDYQLHLPSFLLSLDSVLQTLDHLSKRLNLEQAAQSFSL
jgi:hypothetical protein